MINFKSTTFFNAEPIRRQLSQIERRTFIRVGALIRRIAKRSIRKAAQKPLAEMTKFERRGHHIAMSKHKAGRGKKPRRPARASRPGKPPRSRTGKLKRHIYYRFDPMLHDVFIGPALFQSKDIPGILERGRGKVARRPFMKPALDAARPTIIKIWAEEARK